MSKNILHTVEYDELAIVDRITIGNTVIEMWVMDQILKYYLCILLKCSLNEKNVKYKNKIKLL